MSSRTPVLCPHIVGQALSRPLTLASVQSTSKPFFSPLFIRVRGRIFSEDDHGSEYWRGRKVTISLSGIHPDVAQPEGFLEGSDQAGVTVLISPDTEDKPSPGTTRSTCSTLAGNAPGAGSRNRAHAE